MKLRLREITLKEDTIDDINNAEINTTKYINYIREHLNDANYLIKTKLKNLDDLELYEAIYKIFYFELDEKDILKIFKKKYNKNYVKYIFLNTKMIDDEGRYTSLLGAATGNVPEITDNLSMKIINNFISSKDFIVMHEVQVKSAQEIKKPEKYIKLPDEYPSLVIDKEEEYFPYKLQLFRKEMQKNSTLKRVLLLTKKYINELIHQAKSIQKLGEKDEHLESISHHYQLAFNSNFTKKDIYIKETHKKSH